MELQKTDRLHFMGVGGVSMSALAEALARMGYCVSGCDREASAALARLEAAGVRTYVGHNPAHLDECDVLFYTSAIPNDNPELVGARALGKQVFHRSELICWLMRGKRAIAVTGTHGKTTCSAMLGVVLERAGLDPTVFVGGLVRNWGANYRLGHGPYLVFEADESDRSFLGYKGASQIITSLEDDHLDQHQTSASLDQAFAAFVRQADPEGFVVWNSDSARLRQIVIETPARRISYGRLEGAEYTATEIQLGAEGTGYKAWRAGRFLGHIRLQLLGEHNVWNSLAVIAAAEALGIEFAQIASALEDFEGTGRRFELLEKGEGMAIYDDYAHHPTEIRATLATAQLLGAKRIIAIFQPHLYSRTLYLLNDFAQAFHLADIIFVTEIYAAREAPMPNVSGELVAKRIRQNERDKVVEFIPDLQQLVERIAALMRAGDLIITIGAGNIRQVGEALAEQLGRRLSGGTEENVEHG